MQAGVSGRKQRRLPAEQALRRQRRIEPLRCIEQHRHNALGAAIDRSRSRVRHAQPARQRRPDGGALQDFPFDFRAAQHVLGQRLKLGFLFRVETKTRHAAEQTALPEAGGGERRNEARIVPPEVRPPGSLPDMHIRLIL